MLSSEAVGVVVVLEAEALGPWGAGLLEELWLDGEVMPGSLGAWARVALPKRSRTSCKSIDSTASSTVKKPRLCAPYSHS